MDFCILPIFSEILGAERQKLTWRDPYYVYTQLLKIVQFGSDTLDTGVPSCSQYSVCKDILGTLKKSLQGSKYRMERAGRLEGCVLSPPISVCILERRGIDLWQRMRPKGFSVLIQDGAFT